MNEVSPRFDQATLKYSACIENILLKEQIWIGMKKNYNKDIDGKKKLLRKLNLFPDCMKELKKEKKGNQDIKQITTMKFLAGIIDWCAVCFQ